MMVIVTNDGMYISFFFFETSLLLQIMHNLISKSNFNSLFLNYLT